MRLSRVDEAQRGTESAMRVADVLRAFVTGPASIGVSELARELALSKAVVHRILQSLVSKDFLKHDPLSHSYRLGPSATALGARALRDLDMRRAARVTLESLHAASAETVTISELVGRQRVYLEQLPSNQVIRMMVEIGRPHALHAGASGKAIMAFLPADEQDALITEGLDKVTDVTITDPTRLQNELRVTALRGYAVSLAERQLDVGSVAAPIFGSDGQVVGSLSVCGPVGRFTEEAVASHARLIVRAGAEVSERLGWRGPYPALPTEPLEQGNL